MFTAASWGDMENPTAQPWRRRTTVHGFTGLLPEGPRPRFAARGEHGPPPGWHGHLSGQGHKETAHMFHLQAAVKHSNPDTFLPRPAGDEPQPRPTGRRVHVPPALPVPGKAVTGQSAPGTREPSGKPNARQGGGSPVGAFLKYRVAFSNKCGLQGG